MCHCVCVKRATDAFARAETRLEEEGEGGVEVGGRILSIGDEEKEGNGRKD